MKHHRNLRVLALLLVTALALVAIIPPAHAGEKIVEMKVPEMCASNEIAISFELGDLEGVGNVETDLSSLLCTVTFDDEKISLETIKKVLSDMTLSVESIKYLK